MTKQELEKEIAAEFPYFPPVAVECLASSVLLYHGVKKELTEVTKERDAWKELYQSEVKKTSI